MKIADAPLELLTKLGATRRHMEVAVAVFRLFIDTEIKGPEAVAGLFYVVGTLFQTSPELRVQILEELQRFQDVYDNPPDEDPWPRAF